MGTVMIYNSHASTFVKPDVVELSIRLNSFAQTAADAVSDINKNRQIIKKFICEKSSYLADSYHQYSLDLKRKTHREYFYENKHGQKITEDTYDSLSVIDKNDYIKKYVDKLLGYEANLTITATLFYSDTVVKDLVDIFNMCTELKVSCTYNHTISKSLRETTMQSLYAICINDGVSNVQKIVNNLDINTANNKTVSLLSVMDPAATSMREPDRFMLSEAKACNMYGSAYEPEPVVMPELIEELFNNNIELTKSLDLKFEFA